MKKALILNGYSRNSLSITRSLGRGGIACDLLVGDTGKTSTNKRFKRFKSKFVGEVYITNEAGPEEELVGFIVEILKTGAYNYLLAGGTFYSNLLSKHKEALSTFTHVLIEDYSKLKQVHDKLSCYELAAKLNIPVPPTYLARDLDQLKEIADLTDGKAIVKFSDSHSSSGLKKYNGDREEFTRRYQKDFGFEVENGNQAIIQKAIRGSLHDTTAFAVKGQVIGMLSQERMLTAWIDGGGGVVNVTNDIQKIKEYTEAILKHLNWTGHIEMDWILEEDTGKYYLLEINPKFWGTTELSIVAGYDYPLWFVKYAEGEELPPQNPNYPRGLMFRWLEDELLTIFTESKNPVIFTREFTRYLLRFLRFNSRSTFILSDFRPYIGNSVNTFIEIFKFFTRSN